MMRIGIALTILLFTFFSCGYKAAHTIAKLPQGTYKGQFTRSSPLARYAPSEVTITLTGNKFSGQSDKANYPAIGNGTYEVTGNEIEFVNESLWTADFDWTYILKEKFKISFDGKKLEMIKPSDDHTDQYTLILQ
ncbi:MAG TPA: hypothetical protein VL443_01190 [Cyclobacteriaceae bacterium]|nr:hypothetical protein [Cyclobacteriaceae bacterium]